jgi:hypothetical protein
VAVFGVCGVQSSIVPVSLSVFYIATYAEAYGCSLTSVHWVYFLSLGHVVEVFLSIWELVIVQRGMLPLPWLPPGVWHRSLSCTVALHRGEHPSVIHHTASECRCCVRLLFRPSIYLQFMQLRHKTNGHSNLLLENNGVTCVYIA